MQPLNPGQPGNGMSMKLALQISCRKLKDLDVLSKSDPIVRVYIKNSHKDVYWQNVGETEMKKDNLNPDFDKVLQVSYYFEKQQVIKFEVIDYDSPTSFDMIGTAETTIGHIMGAKGQTFFADLHKDGKSQVRGKIIVKADSVSEANWEAHLRLSVHNLPNNISCFCMGENNPFYEIHRAQVNDPNSFFKVFTSERIPNTTNPSFKQIKLNGGSLCQGDYNLPIKFKIMNQNGARTQEMGEVVTSASQLSEKRDYEIQIGGHRAHVRIEHFNIIQIPNFIDFLRSGWGISLCVAIDFTASNGTVTDRSSLHYLNEFNQYENAINSVGQILEPYDYDKNFPVYGFGGIPRFMGMNTVSHCFPLNGNPGNPEVAGTAGILQTYRVNIPQITLYGPTYFGPILQQMIAIVNSRLSQMMYHIFLIITDGEIHDMDLTRRLVVDASDLPLSIIIIGVGNESFEMMQELDADEAVLRDSRGKSAQRDIVQFVKFKDYVNLGPQALAEEVLKEVPNQFVQYMMSKGISPNVQGHLNIDSVIQ